MKKLLLIALFSIFISEPVFSDEITAKVQGMVCAFCAAGIEKTLSKQDAVEKVQVDLDNMLVIITTKKNKKIDEALVKKVITDAGYTVTEIKTKK